MPPPSSVADFLLHLLTQFLLNLPALGKYILDLPSPTGVLSTLIELHGRLGLTRSLAQLLNHHPFH